MTVGMPAAGASTALRGSPVFLQGEVLGATSAKGPAAHARADFRGRFRVGARAQRCSRMPWRWPQPVNLMPVGTGRGVSLPAFGVAAPLLTGAISPNGRTGASRKRGPIPLSGPPVPTNWSRKHALEQSYPRRRVCRAVLGSRTRCHRYHCLSSSWR